MGYENRDYYREDDAPGGFRLGTDLSVTMRIIIACGAVFLLNLFLTSSNNWISLELLALRGDTLVKPWLWYQFLTHAFVHQPQEIGHLFWTMLGLFFFGPEIERLYGWREYLRFYLATTLLGGLFWAVRTYLMVADSAQPFVAPEGLREAVLFGANAPATAVTLLFCIRFPERSIYLFGVLPVPAWVIGALIIVGNVMAVFGGALHGGRFALPPDPGIVAAAFAILYYRFQWSLGQLPGVEELGRLPRTIAGWFRRRPSLKVYASRDAADDDDAAYNELEAAADRVLDKLHRDGEASLSRQEKQLLERYSRLMRQKHR